MYGSTKYFMLLLRSVLEIFSLSSFLFCIFKYNNFFKRDSIFLKINFRGYLFSKNNCMQNSRFFSWKIGWDNKIALSTKLHDSDIMINWMI